MYFKFVSSLLISLVVLLTHLHKEKVSANNVMQGKRNNRRISMRKENQVSIPSREEEQTFEEFSSRLTENYDPRVRPKYGVEPVTVFCSAFIGSMSDVSETNGDYTVDFYFRQSWVDYRLANFNGNTINMPADYGNVLWRPDTYFVK